MKSFKLQLAFFIIALAFIVKADDIDLSLNLNDELPDDLLDADYALLREIEEKSMKNDHERENLRARELALKMGQELDMAPTQNENALPYKIDPCSKVPCSAGKVCVSEDEVAKCVCIPDCPDETDTRRRVCTNRNETWPSDCEVYRQRCLCDTNDSQCKGKEFKHIHIDYYGECKHMPPCTEEEKNDFPRRMRDWLFNIMRDLAERHELPNNFMEMELEAETNLTRRWANAAIWKWCDLDGHPHDRSVSRHELFPIRAPLMSLEHCIAPFLESCDIDNNHRITLKEWGGCLELNEEDMLDRCDDLATQEVPEDEEIEREDD